MMINIINELNLENGSNYKLNVLRKYQHDELLKQVLKMTYDKVCFTYGIKKIPEYTPSLKAKLCLADGIDFLESLADREYTGHAAINKLKEILESMSKDDSLIITRIIDRDLKINLGRSQINKVFTDLIIKPPYARCGIYSEKTARNITFPALIQVKADGMYQAVTVDNGNVTFTSRSGEERKFPLLEAEFKKVNSGVYIGELLVEGIDDRQEANGMINSDNSPHDLIYMQLWDLIPLEEYADAKHKTDIERMSYRDRFESLIYEVGHRDKLQVIDTHEVQNIQQALELTSQFMNQGLEGSILKDKEMIFKDTTSNQQLKLKLEIELDLRVVGFTEGTKGTKREATFGAIIFTSDDNKIKGQCSGFTDKQLEEFNNKRDELIGKIMIVKCNDITKARNNDYWALSHPRFVCLRGDLETTDTLERAMENRDMAMMLG